MPLSMMENLKLLLASKGIDAATSEAMINMGTRAGTHLANLIQSAIDRNHAQEIAALVGAAATLTALSGSKDVDVGEPAELRAMAADLLSEVESILSGADEDEPEPDPGLSAPPATA